MGDIYGDQLSIAPSKVLDETKIGTITLNPPINSDVPTACIITHYTIQDQEKLQVVECFNEKISTISFGRKPRIITIQGYVEAQYGASIMEWYDVNRPYVEQTGVLINIKKLAITLYGNLQSLTMSISGETPNLYTFSMNLIEKGTGE